MGKEKGFTLLELMIAMLISFVVAGVVYAAHSYYQEAFGRMRLIAELQQNLRASMYLVEMGLKNARYDPTEAGSSRVLWAGPGVFHYEADLNANANRFEDVALNASPGIDEPNERVRFSLRDSCDADEDGIADGDGPCELTRATWSGGGLAMADGIDALNFVYFDGAGNVLGPLPLDVDEPTHVDILNRIRTIEVTIVARSAKEDLSHVDKGVEDPSNPGNPRGYFNLRGTRILDAPNDHFYRRVISRAVDCSNMVERPAASGGT